MDNESNTPTKDIQVYESSITIRDIQIYESHSLGCECEICKKIRNFKTELKNTTHWRLKPE